MRPCGETIPKVAVNQKLQQAKYHDLVSFPSKIPREHFLKSPISRISITRKVLNMQIFRVHLRISKTQTAVVGTSNALQVSCMHAEVWEPLHQKINISERLVRATVWMCFLFWTSAFCPPLFHGRGWVFYDLQLDPYWVIASIVWMWVFLFPCWMQLWIER